MMMSHWEDNDTYQAEAVCVQRFWFFWLLGWHGNVPALQLRDDLCLAEEDSWVGTATVDQLHQTLFIVQPAGTPDHETNSPLR